MRGDNIIRMLTAGRVGIGIRIACFAAQLGYQRVIAVNKADEVSFIALPADDGIPLFVLLGADVDGAGGTLQYSV
jgi:hypothetical protein